MSNPAYTIRNYRSEDFDKLVQLSAEVQDLGQPCCPISAVDLIEILGQPDHSYESNLFIVGQAEEMVGCADVKPEFNIGRVVLRWLLHPKHRKRGVVAMLVDRAIGRAKELGIMTLHANIGQDSRVAKQGLTHMGFIFIRRFLELKLDLSEVDFPESSEISLGWRPLKPNEVERLTQLQNRSFAGTWGYNANTIEEIIYRIHLPNCSPENVMLAFDSDQPIGYCWTRITLWKNKAPGERTGRITMLGVDPDYRGRGFGRELLLAGLSYLKSKGLRVVELTVDTENKVAYALYKSVGFKRWKSSLWYEKKLG